MAGLWLAALASVCFLAPSDTLICNRTGEGTADVAVDRRLLGFRLSEETIKGVRSAELQSAPRSTSRSRRRRPEGHKTATRIVFVDARGVPTPLARAYESNLGKQQQAADELNAFLADPTRSSASIPVRNASWSPLVIGLLLFGAVGSTFGGRKTFLIDKAADTVTVPVFAIRGPRELRCRLSEVEQFLVLKSRNTHGRMVYALGMRLRTGEELPFTGVRSTHLSGRTVELARTLERFRTTPPASPNAADGASAGAPTKICGICGKDCGDAPRFQDESGRYYHQACVRPPAT